MKVCDPESIGCRDSAINAAFDYIIALKKQNPHQPIVINESLGGPSLDVVTKKALDAAIGAGIVVVAAAGNEGDAGMDFPGAYTPVISAGASAWRYQWYTLPSRTWWLDPENRVSNLVSKSDMISQLWIPDWSSREMPGQDLDFIASGQNIVLPYPCAQLAEKKGGRLVSCASKATPDNAHAAPYQYIFETGTSFSSPTIAGIIALMLQEDGSLSNADAAFGTLDDPASWGPAPWNACSRVQQQTSPPALYTSTTAAP